MRAAVTSRLIAVVVALTTATPSVARDVGRGWTVDLTAAGAAQCLTASRGPADEACGAAALAQPQIRYRPSPAHEFGVKLGFAGGHGIVAESPFAVAAWAADLEADVRDINGGDRDHLLTAWYRFTAELEGKDRLQVTAGVIDGTDYLDNNAYANDEFTQFLNGALVNAPNGFVPSYEPGVAVQWDAGPWSLRSVFMRATRNEADRRWHYVGAEAGFTVRNRLGPATARLVLQQTSPDFPRAEGPGSAALRGWILSVDQAIDDRMGLWARVGSQDDRPGIEFSSLLSGGVALRGRNWSRSGDEIGIGLALLRGGNLDTDEARVIEAYYRTRIRPWLEATFDLQHLRQVARDGERESAWVVGLRLVLTY